MRSQLGPYRLLEPIAEGGQGAVWRAVTPDGRLVALKTLHHPDHENLKRFNQEAAVLAKLGHSNLPRIYGRGTTDGVAWLAFELIEGESLYAHALRHAPSAEWSARTLAAIADALEHCHQRGLVHRDVKPTNVVIERVTDRPVLVDFGLVKRDAEQMRLSADDRTRFSLSGSIKGTPEYMAPEQIDATFGDVGPATDVYALGALLFTLLTRATPFGTVADQGIYSVMDHVLRTPPPNPVALVPDAHPGLAELSQRAMSKRPGDRPISARDFKREVLLLAGLPTSTASTSTQPAAEGRSNGTAIALAGVLLAGLIGGAVVWRVSAPSAPSTAPAPIPNPTSSSAGQAVPARPWDPTPHDWRSVWVLGRDAAPRLEPRALWRDDQGREVDPLRSVRGATPGSPVVGFEGAATALGNGRIRVRCDLRAARLQYHRPLNIFLLGDSDTGRALPRGRDAIRLRVPNDADAVRTRVGRAAWERPTITLNYQLLRRVDRERVRIDFGELGTPLALVTAIQRRHTISGSWGDASRSGPLRVERDRPHRIRWEPAASTQAARLLVDGQPVSALVTSTFDGAPRRGYVGLEVAEIDLELGLVLEGRPLSTDVIARAALDPPTSSGVEVLAEFERLDSAPGGPCLALGDHLLELDGATLRLSKTGHGTLAVASLSETPNRGWLSLTRAADQVRASVVTDDGRRDLAVWDPLPAGPPTPSYGSNGPRIRFPAAEVRRGPDEPARRALDDAPSTATALLLAGPSARQRWRRGALLLATVYDPRRAARSSLGSAAAQQRIDTARAAAELLQGAAFGLEPESVRGDALLRAALAWGAAGSIEQVESVAQRLIDRLGAGEARAQLDRFRFRGGKPRFVDLLTRGWIYVHSPRIRMAGHTLAALLAPDRRPEALLGLAESLGTGQKANTPRGRAALRKALGLAREARATGHPNPRAVDARLAELHTSLGEWEAALPFWDRSLAAAPGWWGYLRRAACLMSLGRRDAAVASAIMSYGTEPHPRVAQTLRRFLRGSGDAGLDAVAWWIVGDRASALTAVRRARGGSPRARDLACYVSLVLGQSPKPPPGSRPTAVLARARAGDPRALVELKQACSDPLVSALVRLDPTLNNAQ